MSIQAVFYVIALILLVLAALPLPIPTKGTSLVVLGAAFALLAFSWATITG